MYLDDPCNKCGCDDWFVNRDGSIHCRSCLEDTLARIRKIARQPTKAVSHQTASMGCLCDTPPCTLCDKHKD
jgi:hypothetical protein